MKGAVVEAGAIGAFVGAAPHRAGVSRRPTTDDEIVKVTSPHDDPVTHGNLCIKGRFGFQHVQNRD